MTLKGRIQVHSYFEYILQKQGDLGHVEVHLPYHTCPGVILKGQVQCRLYLKPLYMYLRNGVELGYMLQFTTNRKSHGTSICSIRFDLYRHWTDQDHFQTLVSQIRIQLGYMFSVKHYY